jgi:hypothetical protein
MNNIKEFKFTVSLIEIQTAYLRNAGDGIPYNIINGQ